MELRRRDPNVVLVIRCVGFFVLMPVGSHVSQDGRQRFMISFPEAAIRVVVGIFCMLVMRVTVVVGMLRVMGVGFRRTVIECQMDDQRTGQNAR